MKVEPALAPPGLPRPLAGKPSPALPVWAGPSPRDSLPVEFAKAFLISSFILGGWGGLAACVLFERAVCAVHTGPAVLTHFFFALKHNRPFPASFVPSFLFRFLSFLFYSSMPFFFLQLLFTCVRTMQVEWHNAEPRWHCRWWRWLCKQGCGAGAVTAPLSGNADISAAPPLLFSLRCVILFGRKLLLHKMRGENEHIAVTGGGRGVGGGKALRGDQWDRSRKVRLASEDAAVWI